eukprot:TRINITY_DN95026_c0_g1_i1.p1 TRINITY_DN95026_c0_g1~~TRINITY_DN95026_c0_g1_i1.p1  ORF type:complete len:596 (-),score=88.61 TRINITY_DN95026_c0_g1_i1:32-1795(-)
MALLRKADAGREALRAALSSSQPTPKPGDAADVFSEGLQQWLSAKVLSFDGKFVTLAYDKDGMAVQKSLPLGHSSYRLSSSGSSGRAALPQYRPGELPAAGASAGYTRSGLGRQVCAEGVRCQQRANPGHLQAFAHPFDADYAMSCAASGLQRVLPTLHSLFNWVDADNSGKVSRQELEGAIPLLEALQGGKLHLTEESWEALDEDGNGAVNFHEFAQWAGPRLGLPLGVEHLFSQEGSSTSGRIDFACGINGCLCRGFEPVTSVFCEKRKKKKDKKEKKQKKHKKDSKWEEQLDDMLSGMFRGVKAADDRHMLCTCGHKRMVHRMTRDGPARLDGVPFPRYWSHAPSGRQDCNEIVQLEMDKMPLLQHLINSTYVNTWTRDRKTHSPENPDVPKAFRVVRAFRSENSKNWREYCVRRAEMAKDYGAGRTPVYDVKSGVAWASCAHAFGDEPLQRSCNEWLLFHGTSPEAALSICQNDFRISLAGGSTGTLYGRGTYCAESITKADEYAKNTNGEFAVLLVRALGGCVHYTDELEPDAEDLTRSCIEGPYDSVLGDREKCRGTYREFVFFDTENLYPEYILIYRREY